MGRSFPRILTAAAGLVILAAAAIVAMPMVRGSGLFMAEYDAAPVFAIEGIALRGIDPVAYFTDGRPVPGSPAHWVEWRGVTWLFASEAHRAVFKANPEAYAPQYGGFCAWAVAEKGKLYSTRPESWRIVNGKLYLNYNDAVQEMWEADIPGFIAAADRRWPEMRGDK